MNAVIIGAGIGGLASAIRLRLKGFEVDVLEANAFPGGKLAEFTLDGGYRFDAGPSLFTLPQQMEELFRLAGKDPNDYFRYHRLEVICKYFYEDGTRIQAWNTPERFAREVEEQTGEPAARVEKALRRSQRIYGITNHVFLERSLHKLSTYLKLDTLKSVAMLPGIDPLRTMAKANQSQFSDSRVVQLFNRYATYNGSDPYQAPATLNVIPHLEFNLGAYLPEGGLVAIPRSLHRLGQELGVRYHFGVKATRILTQGKKVTGVTMQSQAESALQAGLFGQGPGVHEREAAGQETTFPADVVVSNMDVVPTYRRLLPEQPAPEKVLRQPRSSSALIFYWGVKDRFPEMDLHNIFFSQNYEAEFAHIWKHKKLYEDPTVYVFTSSKLLPEDAPADGENWFVMINVPADDGSIDWEAGVPEARRKIIDKLERILGRSVEDRIESEAVLHPGGIESRTASYQGALYGSSSNNLWAAFLRHPNFSSRLGGLYFCGGSVHPGGGIPLSLLSARIVGEMVADAPR